MKQVFPKKKVVEIDHSLLHEPELSREEWTRYEEGWHLFNNRKFWEAHEAWEEVWKNCPHESRIFFQGIIQLAAAYHLMIVKNRHEGMLKNFAKAEEKLRLFPPVFLGVDVRALLAAIETARHRSSLPGSEQPGEFDLAQIPTINPLKRITDDKG